MERNRFIQDTFQDAEIEIPDTRPGPDHFASDQLLKMAPRLKAWSAQQDPGTLERWTKEGRLKLGGLNLEELGGLYFETEPVDWSAKPEIFAGLLSILLEKNSLLPGLEPENEPEKEQGKK